MSENMEKVDEGLSEHAYTCLKSAHQAIVDAESKLNGAYGLVTDAASVDDAKKSAELVKIGSALSEAQKDLFRASNEFAHANIELSLSLPAKIWQGFWRVVTSGFFFMAAGVLLIFLAQKGVVGEHSSITFIWVVLGAAILLFGTGTLGMAKLDGTLPSGTWSASVAGGAGALALIIAAGFVWKHSDIKQAFQSQKNYFRIQVLPNIAGGPSVNLEDMHAIATFSNRPIPVVIENKYLEVFVPFSSGIDVGTSLQVKLSMKLMNSEDQMKSKFVEILYKKSGKFVNAGDGGAPVWKPHDANSGTDILEARKGTYYFAFSSNTPSDSSSTDRIAGSEFGVENDQLPPPTFIPDA